MKYFIIISLLISNNARSQIIATFAGNGISGLSGDGGLATNAKISNPQYLTVDRFGNVYYSDFLGHKIRRIDITGNITTVAGNGVIGFSGDGSAATTAKLRFPDGIVCDTFGNLYISDHQNYRIRKVDKATGVITTVAGDGTGGDYGDGGAATSSAFFPSGICFDTRGNLIIADGLHNKIRKVNTLGIITTIAGSGFSGFSGDGGPATAANLSNPRAVAVDSRDNLYFTDVSNKRIRRIDTFGIITTIAGTGIATFSGESLPAISSNVGAYYLAIDIFNNIYFSDSTSRIRVIDTMGILITVAGTGIPSYNGDGLLATTAHVNGPNGITFDLCNNVIFGDALNYRIRKVTLHPFTTPTVSVTGMTTASVGNTVTVNAAITGITSAYTIKWMNKGVQFATTSVPTVTYTKAAGTDTITARVVPTFSYCYDSTNSAPHLVSVGSVGINDVSGMGGYSIYPNPAQHTLTVTGTEAVNTVAITNLLGQALLTEEFGKNKVQVNIAHLPAGMYLIRVNDVWVRRFLKE